MFQRNYTNYSENALQSMGDVLTSSKHIKLNEIIAAVLGCISLIL